MWCELFHWTVHITAPSFLVASGDMKAVYTQCNTTPMNAYINPSKHSGCCTHHLFSHQKPSILATSRFYEFSVGGLRYSKRCSWEHRSSGITVVSRCVLSDRVSRSWTDRALHHWTLKMMPLRCLEMVGNKHSVTECNIIGQIFIYRIFR
jgi:hypothetical protein